eukprot:SAG31_NODE_3212_length_4544_cov_1.849719_5_plen_164_part_00
MAYGTHHCSCTSKRVLHTRAPQKCCHYTVLTAAMEPKLSRHSASAKQAAVSPCDAAVRPGCFISTDMLDMDMIPDEGMSGTGAWHPLKPEACGRPIAGRWGHTVVALSNARLLSYGGFGAATGLGEKNGGKHARMGAVEVIEIIPSSSVSSVLHSVRDRSCAR